MELAARRSTLDDIRPLRERYRREMDCQIIHESIHTRPGWTQEYAFVAGASTVGYGSVAVEGPWRGKPTIYEFYLVPEVRSEALKLFQALVVESGATAIAGQSNDPQMMVPLHRFAAAVEIEKILFRDATTTTGAPPGATFRSATAAECPDAAPEDLHWRGIVEADGRVVASGGVLFHYNPPFGDIYMEVAPQFRRRGYGLYLVQELKRRCSEAGFTPCARCSPDNTASLRTLQKAGFAPCGHLLTGHLARR